MLFSTRELFELVRPPIDLNEIAAKESGCG
jgi:hypothetical protein